jgi:hypothetical protein
LSETVARWTQKTSLEGSAVAQPPRREMAANIRILEPATGLCMFRKHAPQWFGFSANLERGHYKSAVTCG